MRNLENVVRPNIINFKDGEIIYLPYAYTLIRFGQMVDTRIWVEDHPSP